MVRLPGELLSWLYDVSARKGLSVAAYLRLLVCEERERLATRERETVRGK